VGVKGLCGIIVTLIQLCAFAHVQYKITVLSELSARWTTLT